MTLTATLLGTGSSGGVPRIGGDWGACDPNNPKNRRRRCSLLLEKQGEGGTTRVLIDTSPDLREQLLDAGADHIDAVLYTHNHADHVHGIDDLRVLVLRNKARIPVYMHPSHNDIASRFAYCFASAKGSIYPPILEQNAIDIGVPITVSGAGGDITLMPFEQDHGPIISIGFRINNFAYSIDLKAIPEESTQYLHKLDTWVLDCLRYIEHISHVSLAESLALIKRFAPRQTYLTDMHIDMDYETLKSELPLGVLPSFDGLKITISD
jgi:phosphoribosyl 1,2-cyclic phosphate phosphodiesterase